jgi:hypothetical protein
LLVLLHLLLLNQITFTTAFQFKDNANFNTCWNNTVQYFNTSDFNDTRQYFSWNPSHTALVSSRQPQITLPFCESACGDGFQFWPAYDTLLRITMWVFPAVVLLAHFHFPPLGLKNSLLVAMHLMGDPLDTLWSMMTRQEINRRLYRRAARLSDVRNPHHIATVWSTYDELGWRDPSPHFFETLRLRHNPGAPTGYYKNNNSAQVRGPTGAELYYIQLASHRLAANRSESHLTTWVAIAGLGGALAASFIRTYSDKTNNQTAHTIAVVALLFILIPTVKISGYMGSFTSTSVPVDIIQGMLHSLHALDPRAPQLFPPLVLNPDNMPWDYSQRPRGVREPEMEAALSPPVADECRNLENWPKMAPWAGMNCSWRPCKTMFAENNSLSRNRTSAQLFGVSLVFIMCAYAPALVLSYKTPTVGFSCRSVAWTLILISWIFSATVDQVLKLFISSARTLWSITLIKDICITGYFALTIVATQVGFLNSCWCMSGVINLGSQAHLDIAPPSQLDWDESWPLWIFTPVCFAFVILALILTVGADGKEGRTLLSRTETDRQNELLDLMRMRDALGPPGNLQLAHLQDLPEAGYPPVQEHPVG